MKTLIIKDGDYAKSAQSYIKLSADIPNHALLTALAETKLAVIDSTNIRHDIVKTMSICSMVSQQFFRLRFPEGESKVFYITRAGHIMAGLIKIWLASKLNLTDLSLKILEIPYPVEVAGIGTLRTITSMSNVAVLHEQASRLYDVALANQRMWDNPLRLELLDFMIDNLTAVLVPEAEVSNHGKD